MNLGLLVIILFIPIFSMYFVLYPSSSTVLADSVNPGIYSKDSSPYGIPYGKWLANWWQWSISIPTTDHPRDAYSPEKCQVNQGGPVWFLADQLGGREERTCTIPESKSIFIPLLVGECDDGLDEVATDEDIRKCASEGNEHGVIEATINGRKVDNLEQYRTQSGFFNISIPEDNIYRALPGTYKAFADGFSVFLEPLPVGQHEAHLKVSVLNPVEPAFNYNADWTYNLVIEPTNSTQAYN